MECRARGPAAAAGYTAGPGARYKNLLVSDAILSLSLGLALGAAAVAATLGEQTHRRPVRSPPGSQRRGHRRERGAGGGGGGRGRKDGPDRNRPGSSSRLRSPGGPCVLPSSNDL